MVLTFNKGEVLRLLAHSLAAPEHKATYGEDKGRPGLWLVGDEGVYLMSNGNPPQRVEEGKDRCVVVYADQCNPQRQAFDEWWDTKRRSFGGDDGCEVIEASEVQKWVDGTQGEKLRLSITPKRYALLIG